MTIYLASRHHEDTWVKDGYALIDKVPFNAGPLNSLWSQYLTLKVGHFEINYGDQHFRRTDNGQSMYNPFIGNMILDAFTTEVGGELYLRARGAMAMFSVCVNGAEPLYSSDSGREPLWAVSIDQPKS